VSINNPIFSNFPNRNRTFGVLALLVAGVANAAGSLPDDEQALRELITEQTKHLDALKRQLAEADAKIQEIQKALSKDKLRTIRGAGVAESGANGGNSGSFSLAQADQPQPKTVGEPADRSSPQQIAQIFEQPGVLTPRGKFVVEPGLQYGYSTSNRVSLVGYTIIPALVIGLIDVREVHRNTFTPSLTTRWGITNRFEIEAKLPYVYRSDDVVSRPFESGAASEQVFSSRGHGIGDVEFTARYQWNDGGADNPYYISTLRFKTRTGKDPFQVLTDTISPSHISNELQVELPTGSGFYTIQPGLTMLYPADPAVFFGSLSYQYNIKRSDVTMNTTTGPVALGEVAPGGVIGFNFGMGLALNDRSSFSLGYDHSSVARTKINGNPALNSVRTELGTLLLGYSHRIDKDRSLNVSVGVGATRDTPDVQLAVRMPVTF